MKIAWYTPFSAGSAIGRFSHLVVNALRRRGAEVLIIRSEAKTQAIRNVPPICPNEHWAWATDVDRNPAAQLAGYDLVVYNLGDHYEYHAYCFEHQQQAPGLTILHDYCLHHALHHHRAATGARYGTYRDQLHLEAGKEAVAAYDEAFACGKDQFWWHHEIARFPVYRWAMQNTLGVVTHADFYRELVAQRVGCPTRTIPLAYDTPAAEVNEEASPSDDKLTIITIGAVNNNKRYHAVIQAIAASPLLRERCRYRIVGPYDETRHKMIQDAIAAQPTPPDVTMTGQVDRKTLGMELAQADIISCLRYPALEGASASVIEGLLTAKPVVVCDTGCYREIPDEMVYKISPQREHAQLVATLEQIVRNYDAARARAAQAKQWAAARHAPDQYAANLLEYAAEVLYNQPVLSIVDRIANHLRQWNVPADQVLMKRLDNTMHELFSSTNRPNKAA